MIQEDKKLLLRDLCARLPYGAKLDILNGVDTLGNIDINEGWINASYDVDEVKPYLRPMSSMTEEEAKELSILYGIKDILSIKITDEYIEAIVDDGFSSTETRTIWYDEIISSIEIFDWLNAHHFDYRGLIEKNLALDCTGLHIYD